MGSRRVHAIALVGGKGAQCCAEPGIRSALVNSDVEILSSLAYGKECTMTNVSRLLAKPVIQYSDTILAISP